MFNKSKDGINWEPVNASHPVSYVGGVSEVAWHFDLLGNFWGVMRNEFGDESGWGSRLIHGSPDKVDQWRPTHYISDKIIYESSRMFRHGNDLYMIGRTDPDGPYHKDQYWQWPLSKGVHKATDRVWNSLRRHGDAIWKLNVERKWPEKVADLPGCGDTAFASIIRVSKNKFLIANYSSPRDMCKEWSWIRGQLSPDGTAIYFLTIEFDDDDDMDIKVAPENELIQE